MTRDTLRNGHTRFANNNYRVHCSEKKIPESTRRRRCAVPDSGPALTSTFPPFRFRARGSRSSLNTRRALLYSESLTGESRVSSSFFPLSRNLSLETAALRRGKRDRESSRLRKRPIADVIAERSRAPFYSSSILQTRRYITLIFLTRLRDTYVGCVFLKRALFLYFHRSRGSASTKGIWDRKRETCCKMNSSIAPPFCSGHS